MRDAILFREQFVPRPLPEVFDFFSDAENLARITPKSLSFRILTPRPIVMGVGTRIDYRIGLFGIPMRWQTLISAWEPGVRFVDEQIRGPYALWHHEHRFEGVAGGTRMTDRVTYRVPFGPIGAVAKVLFVDRQLRAIFDHRREAIAAYFGDDREDRRRGD
ncbi:MAG: SRPBCC family protein [Polyangiaceae bacterium]